MAKSSSSSRITIIDVARHAGVSISTVSRVINQTAPVSEETAGNVRQAIEALNYVPHTPARQLASRRTNMLGLLLEEISRDFFPPLLHGIETGSREAGYNLLIASAQSPNGASVLGEHNADGVLVFADALNEDQLRQLHATGCPIALLLQTSPKDLDIPCVVFENENSARAITEYLIERRGYTRIAFLRGPEGNEDSYLREQGYREALRLHGIPFIPELVAVGGFDEQEAQVAVDRWLVDGVGMDAIFAADDESAIGAIIALKRAGLHVPEDVGVVGFDDIPMARYVTPPLTTVHAPIERAGYEAARQLIGLIEHGRAEPVIQLPTELVIRASCGGG
jgi:LacI family transcriptional regulator